MIKKLKNFIAAGLIIVLALPTVSYIQNNNTNYHATTGESSGDVDIFVLGSGYFDAYPIGRINGVPYYAYTDAATGKQSLVGGTEANSTYANR